jgi:hypothetical protein
MMEKVPEMKKPAGRTIEINHTVNKVVINKVCAIRLVDEHLRARAAGD